jgi:hypothetical protein
MSETSKPERSDHALRQALERFAPKRPEPTDSHLPEASKQFNAWLHAELRHRRGLDRIEDDDQE